MTRVKQAFHSAGVNADPFRHSCDRRQRVSKTEFNGARRIANPNQKSVGLFLPALLNYGGPSFTPGVGAVRFLTNEAPLCCFEQP
jgi:hypothetical protein